MSDYQQRAKRMVERIDRDEKEERRAAEQRALEASEANLERKGTPDKQELRGLPSVVVETTEAEREADKEARTIGYTCSWLLQATLPHSDPGPNCHEYMRRDGKLTVRVLTSGDAGMPYGRYPRQLLAYLGRKAKLEESRAIYIGKTKREFISEIMGRGYSGGRRGTATAITDQLRRLTQADIQGLWRDEEAGLEDFRRLSPIHRSVSLWDPQDPNRVAAWQSHIQLSHEYYDQLMKHAVPLDLETLANFRSPLEMDFYSWLTARVVRLEKSLLYHWEWMQYQFGSDYAPTPKGRRHFKERFLPRLQTVRAAYPAAKVDVVKQGLMIHPSPPHVELLSSSPRCK